MNKVLVKLYIPKIEEQYDVWIPVNKSVYNVINLLIKAVNELSRGHYTPREMPTLYDKITAVPYDVNLKVYETTIRNGSEIVLI